MADHLPRRFLLTYTPLVAKKFFVCVVSVAWKLGQPGWFQLACVAEELALHPIIKEATSFLEARGEEADFALFEDAVYEDMDFLILFDPSRDGLDQSAVGAHLGMGSLDIKDWFTPFGGGSHGAIHPYVREEDMRDY